MIRKGFKIKYLPLKTYVSMEVSAATEPVQEYDATTNEFYPDRTAAPLVLTPRVGFTDPNNGTTEDNAASMLTDGHWYRLDNTTSGELDSVTEITSGTDYIIDTLAGSDTYGRITISENVSPGNPVTYVFRATLTHPNGEKKIVEIGHQARTKAVATIPVLSLDNASEVMYDPFGGEDMISFHPILTPSIPTATFAWESLHGTAWAPLESTLLDWAVGADGNGVKVKQSVMPDRIDLRCTATIPVSGGGNIQQTVAVSVVRRLPSFSAELGGVMDVNPDVKSISPMAKINLGGKILTDLKSEIVVVWKNYAGDTVGYGLHPVIPISSLKGVLEIGFEVVDAGGWCAVTDSDGKFLVDSENRLIITKRVG